MRAATWDADAGRLAGALTVARHFQSFGAYVLSSRCLVCRPSHLGGCRVGTPPARKYLYIFKFNARGANGVTASRHVQLKL